MHQFAAAVETLARRAAVVVARASARRGVGGEVARTARRWRRGARGEVGGRRGRAVREVAAAEGVLAATAAASRPADARSPKVSAVAALPRGGGCSQRRAIRLEGETR